MWRRICRKNDEFEDEFKLEMQPLQSSATPSTIPPLQLQDGDVVMLMWRNHGETEDSVTSEGLK